MKNIPIILLCGGRGKRLGQLSEKIPKPLVRIGKKTLIEEKLDYYKKIGINNFYLCIGYKGNLIKKHLSKYPAKIAFSDAGKHSGILKRIRKVLVQVNKPCIISYGDTLAKINLKKLYRFHKKSHSLITIVVSSIQNPFGLVEWDRKEKVKKFIEKPIQNHFLSIVWITLGTLLIIFLSYAYYIDNSQYFYTPTTGTRVNNIFSYLIIFYFTNIIFYLFTNYLTNKKFLSLIVTLLWMFSALHIANLFPSVFRDYLKSLFFFCNFFYIVFFIKNNPYKIDFWQTLVAMFLLFLSLAIRADFKMLIPIFLYLFILHIDIKEKKNLIKLSSFIFLSLIFLYLSSSVYEDRNIQRFGAYLSADNSDTFLKSIGPIDDGLMFYQSCAFYSCDMMKTFITLSLLDIKLILLRFGSTLIDILMLPFKYSLILSENNLIFKIINLKSFFFNIIYNFKIIYFFLLIWVLQKKIYKNYFFFINIIVILLYITFIFSFLNQTRHYFYFEGISLMFLILIITQMINVIKKKFRL